PTTAASPAAARIRRTASFAFVSLRAIITSCAPRRASSTAAARPIPLVAPVISTRLPATPPQGCIRGHPTMVAEDALYGNRNRSADVAQGATPAFLLDWAQRAEAGPFSSLGTL